MSTESRPSPLAGDAGGQLDMSPAGGDTLRGPQVSGGAGPGSLALAR